MGQIIQASFRNLHGITNSVTLHFCLISMENAHKTSRRQSGHISAGMTVIKSDKPLTTDGTLAPRSPSDPGK